MTRVLTVLIIVSCRYAVTASATELPLIPHGAAQSVLDGLRQNALEDWKQGRLEKAVDCYREILRVSEASPGKELAEDLHNMAVIHTDMGSYREAKIYFHRELELLQHAGNQVAAGLAYRSIAGILQIEGAFSEAEASYENALELLNRYAGPNDVRTATTLNSMAWLYTLWGRTLEARQYLEKASEAVKGALPPNDPHFIRFLDVRASFLSTMGKYSEAEEVWERALQIGETAYPHDDSKYEEVFLHLGQLYSIVEDFKSAEKMFDVFSRSKSRWRARTPR